MFKRNIKTTLPEVVGKQLMESHEERNEKVNQKMKERYDMKCKPCNMKIGDKVLVKLLRKRKIDASYDNEIYEIISINGTMIAARSDNSTVTRNSSFFKLVH